MQWLADRCEIDQRPTAPLHVVEADDRHILSHLQPLYLQCAQCCDCDEIVNASNQCYLPASNRRNRHMTDAPVLVEMLDVSTQAAEPDDRIENISLTIRADEIIGIAGVDGSGQRGLVSVLSGGMRPSRGSIRFDGRGTAGARVSEWRAAGLAHLPADRFSQGGTPTLSLIDNAVAGTDGNSTLQWGPFLKRGSIRRRVQAMVEEFSVRMCGIGERLDSLSGGNAQKLIAARKLASNPRLLIAHQPTRGIDVASAAFLHGRMPAYLRVRYGASEMVNSLALNFAFLYLGIFVLNYYLRDPNAGSLMSYRLPRDFSLDRILQGTRLHTGVVMARAIST